MYFFVHSHINSFLNSHINLFIHSCMYSFIILTHSFIYSFSYWFFHSLTQLTHAFIHLLIPILIHLLIYSCIHLLIDSFVHRHTKSLILSSSDPDVWFLENDHIMVTKTREEGTIPCLVTNPSINVTLYERDTEIMVEGSYDPSMGFTAALEDRNYKCKGELNGEEKESISFFVFSIFGTLDPVLFLYY